jgi:hypothetical protein
VEGGVPVSDRDEVRAMENRPYLRAVEDVFDLTGDPPPGWMHAVFEGGPYAKDVGRCVPIPPADHLDADGVRYRIVNVVVMSSPDHEVALYSSDGAEPYSPSQ